MIKINKLNVGIIGYGMAGKVFHAPIVDSIDCMNLKTIVSSRETTTTEVNRRYPNTQVIASVDQLLNDQSIDLVVIGVPNQYHFELTEKALAADKHVVVEKPFTITSKDAKKLIVLAKEKQKILTVHQNRRWDSDFLTVKKVIENNLLGELVEYEAHFDNFKKDVKADAWREKDIPGAGFVYDLASHLIDQSVYLFGKPKKIFADIRQLREEATTDDNYEIVLSYENLKVTLKTSMLVREETPHFILHGTQGSFVKYGFDVQEGHLKQGLSPLSIDQWGVEPEKNWGRLNTEIDGLHVVGTVESEIGDYRKFYENVYKAIVNGEELIVKPEQAMYTIYLIEKAFESNEKGTTITL